MLGNVCRVAPSKHRLLAVAALSIVFLTGLGGCRLDDEKTGAFGAIAAGGTPATPPAGGGGGDLAANRAPTISGRPVTTAKIDAVYVYQPAAADPDGDTLTFTIRAKPAWASFDEKTGRLQGTPPRGSSGRFTGVQIVVSDGKATAATPAFSIDVVEPAVGTARLTWQPPTLNEDGTPLTDLSGYVIRYGKDSAMLDQSLRIANPGVTSAIVENLAEGRWFFTLTSFNAAGVESQPSDPVSKSIS